MAGTDRYGTSAELIPGVAYHCLAALAERGIGDVSHLPVTLKILLDSVRNAGAPSVREGDVEAIARWNGTVARADRERAFMPARVLLQDFTGVPAVVDLAAMRSAVARAGGDPMRIDLRWVPARCSFPPRHKRKRRENVSRWPAGSPPLSFSRSHP